MLTRKSTQIFTAVLVGLLLAALMLPASQVLPNGIIADDGYFYLQIAHNLGYRFQSSFDGVHPTSGYHLLWGALLGVLAALLSAFTTSKAWFIFVSLAAVLSLAAYTAARYFRDPWQRLFVFAFLVWSCSMTEAALLTLLLLHVFSRALAEPRDFLTAPADVVAVALIPLTRIDATIMAAVFGLFFLATDQRKFTRLLASLAAGLALQFAAMQVIFGSFFSVSSTILWDRSGVFQGPGMLWRHAIDNASGTTALTVSCLSAGFLAVSVLAAPARERKERRWLAGFIVLACASFLIPHLLLGSMREWYWTAPVLSLFYVASQLTADEDVVRSTVLKWYALGMCAVIATDLAMLNIAYAREQRYTTYFVSYVNRVVPPSEKIFQEDASGFVGFWSTAPVVNGDGLVNSHDYGRRLAANDLRHYLEEEDICFIIRDWPLEDERIVAIGGLTVSLDEAYPLIEPPDDARSHIATQLKLYLLKAERCRRLAYLVNARS